MKPYKIIHPKKPILIKAKFIDKLPVRKPPLSFFPKTHPVKKLSIFVAQAAINSVDDPIPSEDP
jgi:hypothetical protein